MSGSQTDNPFAPPEELPVVSTDPKTLPPVVVELETRAILERCWALLMGNKVTMGGVVLIPWAVDRGFAVFDNGVTQRAPVLEENISVIGVIAVQLAIAIASVAASILFSVGSATICTRLAQGLPADLGMLTSGFLRVPAATLATALFVLAVVPGLVLIYPGLVVAVGLHLYLNAFVDRHLGPIQALRESWRLTHGYKGTLVWVYILTALALLAATVLTLGIGLLVVIPTIELIPAVVYVSLLHRQGPKL